MRLVSLRTDGATEAAIVVDEHAIPVRELLDADTMPGEVAPQRPVRMIDLLVDWSTLAPILTEAADTRGPDLAGEASTVPISQAPLAAPLPRPSSFRDFYAFEEHVARSWKRRGEPVPEAWYEIPVFYFSNPAAIVGPGDPVRRPTATQALDFELEIGWVIGQQAIDLEPDEAEDVIAGLTILNDFSARDVQAHEMSVGLGPSKGKDFATGLGPQLVTLDELEDARSGKAFDLTMVARVNGEEVSRGNLDQIHYSLGEMTAHASQDVRLTPGDLMGTGTVGTGSILDLGTDDWLEPGDVVELEVDRLGTLTHRITG